MKSGSAAREEDGIVQGAMKVPVVEIESQRVAYLSDPLTLMEIANQADPVEGILNGVVRVSFDDLVRGAHREQGGEVDVCSEALGGYLPGASITRIIGAVADTDLLVEVSIDVRNVFWTAEYDLAHGLAHVWEGQTADTLEAALAAWQSRDQRPQPNPIR